MRILDKIENFSLEETEILVHLDIEFNQVRPKSKVNLPRSDSMLNNSNTSACELGSFSLHSGSS